jgi:ankyrin repeat protein
MSKYDKEFKTLSDQDLNDFLNSVYLDACEKGDLDQLKYILTSPELEKHANLNEYYCFVLNFACDDGKLEFANYLLNFDNYQTIIADRNVGLILASGNGHLDIVRYMLTTPIIKDTYNNQDDLDLSLQSACGEGHLEVVRYLLTSPELENHADIHFRYDNPLNNAIFQEKIEIVKYLLTSPELEDKADIHANNDHMFITAAYYHRIEILRYLIFDLNLERTKYINNSLEKEPRKEIEDMFNLRELNKSLSSELDTKNKNNKRSKI